MNRINKLFFVLIYANDVIMHGVVLHCCSSNDIFILLNVFENEHYARRRFVKNKFLKKKNSIYFVKRVETIWAVKEFMV